MKRISKNPIFLKLFSPGSQVVQLQIEGEMASVAAHLVFASVAELLVKLVKPVDSRSPCNSCGQICPQIFPIFFKCKYLQYQISQKKFYFECTWIFAA